MGDICSIPYIVSLPLAHSCHSQGCFYSTWMNKKAVLRWTQQSSLDYTKALRHSAELLVTEESQSLAWMPGREQGGLKTCFIKYECRQVCVTGARASAMLSPAWFFCPWWVLDGKASHCNAADLPEPNSSDNKTKGDVTACHITSHFM